MANDIEQILKRKLLKATKGLPVIIANEARNISLDAFKNEAWDGAPWPARNPKAKRNSRKLLVDTSQLINSVYAKAETDTRIIWGSSGIRYARIHNDGGIITQAARSETFRRNRKTKGLGKGKFKKGISAGQGFTFKERRIVIPRRRFIGSTANVISRLINAGRQHILKSINS